MEHASSHAEFRPIFTRIAPLAMATFVAACGDPCNQGIYADNPISAGVGLIVEAVGCKDPSASNRNTLLTAQAEMQVTVSREINAIDPLPAPLAQSVLVALPTRDQLVEHARLHAPAGMLEQGVALQADLLVAYTDMWPALIRRRGIFADLASIRYAALAPADGGAGRIVVEARYSETQDEFFWYLRAPGGGDPVQFFTDSPLGEGKAHTMRFLNAIEDFVRTHGAVPPAS